MDSADSDVGTRRTRNSRSRIALSGENTEVKTAPIKPRKRPVHKYGNVPEEVGTIYKTRTDLQVVHHPTTNWIHTGPEGPYSMIILKTKRFLDEGPLIVLSTGETKKRYTALKKNCIEDNLIKALRSHLPIRIIRAIKKGPGGPATFRYDGLYRMKKRFTLDGKLKFLLARDKNQAPLQFNWGRNTGHILHMLSLVKKFTSKNNRSMLIKQEFAIKEEFTTNSTDSEKDFTRTITWEHMKEETASIDGDESCLEAENEEYAVPDWEEERSPFNDRDNFDETIEIEHTSFAYSTSFTQKTELIYEDEEEIIPVDGECAEDFLNDDEEIIDTIPVFNCVNGENDDNVESCIIFPENDTSVCLKELVNVDPLSGSDPLEVCNDENKTCNFNESRTSSDIEEVKNCDEKSTVLYPLNCEKKNVDYEGEHNDFIPHPCVYSLTLAQIINFINGTNDQNCPCKMSRCNGQIQFEAALKSVIGEQGKLKCNKGGSEDESEKSSEKIDETGRALEKVEEKNNYSVNDFFMQLAAPFQIRKKSVRPTRIIKTTGKSTRKLHVKKSVTIRESLASQEIPKSPIPFPLREDPNIPENINLSKERQRQVEVDDVLTTLSPQKRRKKRQGQEAASLGPVIDPNDDNTPRSSKGRKLSYPPGRSTVSQTRRKRSTRNNQGANEEDESDGFRGFVGPIKPSKKIKMIKTYIKRLSKSFC